MKTCRFVGCLVALIFLSTFSARANVYATDIKLNGSLSPITNNGPVTVTYRLNQAATLGVTVAILQGTTNVATLVGGTNMGLNTVVWGATNSSGAALTSGNYTVSITAAASGFTTWKQISVDSNPGMPAYYPLGIAVDNNTNSPYYGRVVMSCALAGTTADAMVGLYKMNADGSQADEGWYGNASYLSDDAGDAPVSGQMPGTSPFNVDPMKIRIGDDDRIYWVDDSFYGAIIACDMQATNYQIVIDYNNSPHNYSQNPDFQDLFDGTIGIQEFDVSETTTTNAAVWLCDNDFPGNWGIWMYHLTNGASDLNDQFGVQVVQTGGDLSLGSTGGCMVDNNLDIFVGQNVSTEEAVYNSMEFTNWNAGVLPPPNTNNGSAAFTYVTGTAAGQVEWGFGCAVDTTCATNPYVESVNDVVLNSRLNPTMVACPMSFGANNGADAGIRVLNATNGSVISVTNGSSVQTLTNLDGSHAYTCAAWDNVGNLYGASTNLNLWRVWSPPGGNTNTTAVGPAITLSTNVVVAPTVTVTITKPVAGATFSPPANVNIAASVTASGTTVTNVQFFANGLSLGNVLTAPFSLTASNLTADTYALKAVATAPGISATSAVVSITVAVTSTSQLKITSIARAGSALTILFTATNTATASSFTLQSSTNLSGTFSAVTGANITGSAGDFTVTTTVPTGAVTQFYRIEQ
jgi:hypothetical protein